MAAREKETILVRNFLIYYDLFCAVAAEHRVRVQKRGDRWGLQEGEESDGRH